MRKYILNRLVWLVIITICVALIIFTITYFIPGDPAQIILGAGASQADLIHQREILGLDKPFLAQLGDYMYSLLHLDFGISFSFKVPVIEEFAIRLPRTLLLGIWTLLLTTIVGIPLGVTAALNRGKIQDTGLLIIAMILISIPQFWLALLMVILFSLKLHILPNAGIGGIEYWIMPILAGALSGIATTARQTRSAVLETVNADFVTTARAKGVPEWRVTYLHMLPNALNPVINMLGMQFAVLIAGSVVIESVFSFPGIGLYMLSGINSLDYPVIRGCVLLMAIFSTVVMLLTDLAYAFLDPRIKAQYINASAKKGAKKK
ncbi:MAG: ABC transporter permease [Clostridiales bacterium]|nr:ABC transporter permease [Clostridiales bacterium]